MDYLAAKAFILEKLQNELSEKLSYHGLHHTLDVLQVTQELCELMEVELYDAVLLKSAALFHDSGFMINNVDHELLGCQIAREHLPRFGYLAEDLDRICGMIMATRIPQSPQNYLEEIICDADLDYLGRSDFYQIGATLFQELQAYQVLDNEEDWNRIQVRFLENHSFFTAINRLRRTPQKMQYLDELKSLVESYS